MSPAATHLVFVYGTLKAGFRNAHVNEGQPVGRDWATVRPHPLYIIGRRRLPWLLDRPGEGHAVQGELVAVDDAGLARMDALERLDDPTWYLRRRVTVAPVEGGAPQDAWVYFGSEAGFLGAPVHAGPLPAYTRALELQHPPESD
jgi:gamma-glutamylaminecyclotransferase